MTARLLHTLHTHVLRAFFRMHESLTIVNDAAILSFDS